MEIYLHEFLRDNWEHTELAREWALYEEDGELVGYKYRTSVGEIDLLARHRGNGNWLVVELKRDRTSDTTVGQILRYLGWVEEHLAAAGEEVKGLIIGRADDEKLRYALKRTSGIDVMRYEVDFRLVAASTR